MSNIKPSKESTSAAEKILSPSGTVKYVSSPETPIANAFKERKQLETAKIIDSEFAALRASHAELLKVSKEMIYAEQEIKRVVDEHPAGTCNCEDAHKEAYQIMDAAEKQFRKEVKIAEKLTQ